MNHTDKISKLFKAEYSNLVAVLCQFYGVVDIQTAEDIVSDTFLTAVKTWSHNGLPELPKAWLRKVAINRMNDIFRRKKTYDNKVIPNISKDEISNIEHGITEEIINDSQLRMIFAICHPSLKKDAQLCLALRILCGFNVEEIAIALLTNKQNINKKLYRAKQKFKAIENDWQQLSEADYKIRLNGVLRIIYLVFNEGYYSSVSETNIRHELCWEAMRLCLFLSRQKLTSLPKVNALIALMCFHVSRFNSRINEEGQSILYDNQDRKLWDYALIEKGEIYLSRSSLKGETSKYHLEAAIAFWHTTDSEEKWHNILQLYNRLLTIEYSPITALNRTYALARANSVEEALVEIFKLDLKSNHLYYSLIAELYRMSSNRKLELENLKMALSLANKVAEKEMISRKIEKTSLLMKE